MPRDWTIYIEDITSAIARIEEYIGESTYLAFKQDLKTIDAVVRNLEIIGEAAKRLPPEIRTNIPPLSGKRFQDCATS